MPLVVVGVPVLAVQMVPQEVPAQALGQQIPFLLQQHQQIAVEVAEVDMMQQELVQPVALAS